MASGFEGGADGGQFYCPEIVQIENYEIFIQYYDQRNENAFLIFTKKSWFQIQIVV